jgi:hypothetical protein
MLPEAAKTILNARGSGAVCGGGTGIRPMNHAQDARATFKLNHNQSTV